MFLFGGLHKNALAISSKTTRILGRMSRGLSPAHLFLSKWDERPRVDFSRGSYRVKTVSSRFEQLQVQKLRYEVFHREYMGKKFPLGLDREKFDGLADHLVIIDLKSDKIVGTYRLLPSSISDSFYSETEFDLSAWKTKPGVKIELSRACVSKDHRNGIALAMLWRGVLQYAQAYGADYLFGMASVKSMNVDELCQITAYLRCSGAVDDEIQVKPLGSQTYKPLAEALISSNHISLNAEESGKIAQTVPPLLKAYLKAGAKVIGFPVIDWEFHCADYFTVLNLRDLKDSYSKKFQ